MPKTKTNKSAARDAGHSISFAESVIIQADGDLSDKEFRRYVAMLAEKEIASGPLMPANLTIEHGLEYVESVRQLADEILSDYDSAMDDPENNVEGWKVTDMMEEFLRRGCFEEVAGRRIVALGESIERSAQ